MTPCGKTDLMKTSLSYFQKIYNFSAVILALLLTIYSAMNSSEATETNIIQYPMFCCCCYENDDEESVHLSRAKGQMVERDDYYGVTYNYSSFHLIYLSAGMFLMMTLTNWISPSDSITASTVNTYTFWIKSITTIIIILVYLAMLALPICCSKEQYQEYRNKVENVVGLDSDELRQTRRFTRKMENLSDLSSISGISLQSFKKNSVHPSQTISIEPKTNKYNF